MTETISGIIVAIVIILLSQVLTKYFTIILIAVSIHFKSMILYVN